MALLLIACSRESPTRVPVPLPRLPEGPIELRVVYLENPRFTSLSGHEQQAVLASATAIVKANFGRDVVFSAPEVRPIASYFDMIDRGTRAALAGLIFDFKRPTKDPARLIADMEKSLREAGEDLDAMIDFAAPHLTAPIKDRTYSSLASALVLTQLQRIGALAAQTAADGKPVLDAQPYNEVMYWDVMYRTRLPYEVVITNQLLASVEYGNNSVHSALRGGITNGFTTPNEASRFGTTAILSVYPFVSDDAAIRALREGETYTRADALRYAGVMLAHELGHQLWHLGHPFGRTACVMSPAPMLHFRRWVEALSPADCPLAADGPMKPGFARIYRPAL